MELIKKPFKIGNSAAVLIPKRWEKQQIIVRPLEKSITKDVIEILDKRGFLEEVSGIYLIGSYARGDYELDSDIDVLVVSSSKREIIIEGNYEITIIPEKNLLEKISKDLYFFSSIREAVPLINKTQLEVYKKVKQRFNVKRLLEEIQSSLRINEEAVNLSLEINDMTVLDGTIYSLVLRLRELYLLKTLIMKKKVPSKKEFLFNVDKESYKAYLRVKRNEKQANNVRIEKAIKLVELTKRWLKEVKEL